MMRLRVFSDLHLDRDHHQGNPPWVPPALDSDTDTVLVIPGDLWDGANSIPWLEMMSRRFRAVIFVPGNHDYFHSFMGGPKDVASVMRDYFKGTNVHVLTRGCVDIDGYRFIGATLWTDFYRQHPVTMELSRKVMWRDYAAIRYFATNGEYDGFLPIDWLGEHLGDLAFIQDQVSASPIPTVVVTHHAPSEQSCHERYRGDPSNAFFASRLDEYIYGSGVSLWCHGHMHSRADYKIGSTRILCNPRGYVGLEDIEFTGFDEDGLYEPV